MPKLRLLLLLAALPMALSALPAHAQNQTIAPAPHPFAQQYIDFALQQCDEVEKRLPHIVEVAETVAKRHLAGGRMSFPWNGQGLQQELSGRSGGMMMMGGVWKERDPAGDAFNIAIIGWDRAPRGDELKKLQGLKAKGTFILGFGPKQLPSLAPHRALCDAFIDTGLGANDHVVTLPDGQKVAHGNGLVNMLNGWAFTGELVATLTRSGKMPTMWKGWLYPDGRDWSNKYTGQQFHTDFPIEPIAPGALTRAYLAEMRGEITRFAASQTDAVAKAVALMVEESKAGRKTIVATEGHAPWTYVARYEDAQWATLKDFDASSTRQMEDFLKNTPDGALVLRLGYSGLDAAEAAAFTTKKQRVILVASPSPLPERQFPPDLVGLIDPIWAYGDAVVSIAGYPIKILPPSGIMQQVVYESLNSEILARLPRVKPQIP